MSAERFVADIEQRAAADAARVSNARMFMADPRSRPDPSESLLVDLIRADQIVIEPIRWLWGYMLARGKLHVLAGAPGTGKTTIALALGSVITRGGIWPDGSRAPLGSVLVWSGEDDPADTLAPRLKAMGADLSRVFFVRGVLEDGERRAFDPATDLQALRVEAEAIGDLSLIIADPIVSAVAGDSHKNTEVRRALQPMVNLAAELGAAVLGISHFSKGTAGREPLERVTGSLAFGALARVVLVTAKGDSEDGDSRILARAKSNIGPDGGGFKYALEMVDIGNGIEASKVTWGGAVDGTARELLAAAEPSDSDEHEERKDAAAWLTDLLESGSMPAKQVRQAADQAGFAWRTVQRAMKVADVESRRDGFGKEATYKWRLRPSMRATESPCAPCAPHSEAGAHGAHGAHEWAQQTAEVDL